ncbi:MAG: 3-isopropylmalate dehydratase small subunit [Candidatus Bathyarchaeia archaeon]
MSKAIRGRVWKFGDNINTDLICPGPLMRLPLDQIGQAAMAGIDPNFHKKIKKGDIIVAGENFGSGSSRELAPLALKKAGIGGIVAEYFARIFYRNCIALGFPIMECKEAVDKVDEGDELEINVSTGRIRNLTKNEEYRGTKYPDEFREIFEAGGIIPWIRRRGVSTLRR